jgi:hypothetical protein
LQRPGAIGIDGGTFTRIVIDNRVARDVRMFSSTVAAPQRIPPPRPFALFIAMMFWRINALVPREELISIPPPPLA